MASNPRCLSYWDDSPVIIYPKGMPSKTQQQFRDVNDLNTILRNRHPATLPLAEIESEINDLSKQPTTLAQAIEFNNRINSTYDAIPSNIRKHFRNGQEMLEFLADEKNRSRAEELGLLKPKPKTEVPLADQIVEGIVKATAKQAKTKPAE